MLHVIYWLGMRYPFLNYFLQFYSHCIVTHFTFKGCKFTVYIFTSFFLIINQIILKCVNCLHYSYYQPVIDALIYIYVAQMIRDLPSSKLIPAPFTCKYHCVL